ncbi:DUF1127 domain-containing protein [Bradyrhizobium tropiciagri]|uniref:DUF1127 domain-containing protein n=1 Tax=Bradyrhizobium tropiciagri TaxID=312253 RepID=UPI001BA97482|nr:DUF1127 domain-containing protein [Bradyrhizobium tropiciagri]MBR0873325.1 DUF1127 domain-containing protein [Bradyrhizobium tropiciagri]
MSMQNAAPNANRAVRRVQSAIGEGASATRSRDGAIHRLYPVRAARSDQQPLVPIAERDPSPASPWRVALEFVMEGFAMYGASLHPTAAMPVQLIRASSKPDFTGAQRSAGHDRRASQRLGDDASVELARAARADVDRSYPWSWPGALAGTIKALWTHWRREREIRRAVSALSQYDDRILRDLGIHGRADIERAVRCCHD